MLRTDPAGVYPAWISSRAITMPLRRSAGAASEVAEDAVARAAIQLAAEASQRDGSVRREPLHVGFISSTKADPRLERVVRGSRVPPSVPDADGSRFPLFCYLGPC